MIFSYWRRLIQTASPGTQQRFIETFDFFFQSVTEQAHDRQAGAIPDLESYIALRRDTSGSFISRSEPSSVLTLLAGCKTSFVLIEYAYNLDIPDEVMDHDLIRGLGEAANDLVTWSNVCSSSPSLNPNTRIDRWTCLFRIFSHTMSSNPRAIPTT